MHDQKGPGAYFGSSSGNVGGVHRDSDVDLEDSADTDGGYNVGWMAAGEWLQYTVDVGAAGEHLLEVGSPHPHKEARSTSNGTGS